MAERPALVSATDPDSLVQQRVSIFGAGLVSTRRNLVDNRLGANAVASGRWTTGSTGSGSVVFSGLTATVQTGATAGSTAFLQTARPATFWQSYENEFGGILSIIGLVVADNRLRWGMFDANDGMFFEVRAGVIRIVTRKSGVDTIIPQSVFNGTQPFVLNTNRHFYSIRYLAAYAQFVQDLALVHQQPVLPSVLTGPLVDNMTVPVRVEVSNGATASNAGLVVDGLVAQRWAVEEEVSASQTRRGTFTVSNAAVTIMQSDFSRIRTTTITNRVPQPLYVKLGPAAATNDYDFLVAGNETLPIPWKWGGEVSAIRAQAVTSTNNVGTLELFP